MGREVEGRVRIGNTCTPMADSYAAAAAAKLLQSCPTLCDPIDGSPPSSPIPGILQARILEWVAIAFSPMPLAGVGGEGGGGGGDKSK